MQRVSIAIRITCGLLAISLSVFCFALLLGLFSDDTSLAVAREQTLLTKFRLVLFITAASFVAFFLFLRRILADLYPTRAIPERVQSALNTLSEGVVILDEQENIVLANSTFARMMARDDRDLVGQKASTLGWQALPNSNEPLVLPWLRTSEEATTSRSALVALPLDDKEHSIFRVTSATLRNEDQQPGGAMVTFSDVTAIERSHSALRNMLREICNSREEIKRQNNELQILAMRDPLTSCLNRRAFHEQFETHWKNAVRYQVPISCIMLDLDHFKQVNDRFGHVVGDQVLQEIGRTLLQSARDTDVVCRYGGEEFCILLPHCTLEQAREAADRYQRQVKNCDFKHFKVTVSIGVAERTDHTKNPHELISLADRSLYEAKRNGRNRVVAANQLDLQATNSPWEQPKPMESAADERETTIPFNAVTALFSALGFRDIATAEHSRRVADLCVAAGEALMSHRDLYVLEVAALLHDIGKIGVPDAILLKPDALTPEEWAIMTSHARIGVEILHSAFSCEKLTEMVRMHRLWFSGQRDYENLETGEEIPLGSRLLLIADAYDSMTTDRVYRKGRTSQEAFEELRRCAGRQFDPQLTEHFISVVKALEISREEQVESVSRQTALKIGMEIERLVHAIDTQDVTGMQALAGRLKDTAKSNGIEQLAQLASSLEESIHSNAEPTDVLPLVQQLIELCRSTQRAYLRTNVQDQQAGTDLTITTSTK